MTLSIRTALRHLKKGEWEKAHAIVQKDDSMLGAWAHGIVHLLEGDHGNARYWYRRAQRPFPDGIEVEAEIAALADAVDDAT